MRRTSIPSLSVLAALAAGCRSPSTTTPRAERSTGTASPGASVAAVEKVAPGAPADGSIDQALERLESLADRGCGCDDATCIAAVDAELATLLETIELPDPLTRELSWPAEPAARRRDAERRLRACVEEAGTPLWASSAVVVLRHVDELRSRACACTDATCAATIRDALAVGRLDALPPELPRQDEIRRVERDARACLEPFARARTAEAVAALRELSDRACACPDAACVEAVATESTAVLGAYADVEDSPELRAASDEYLACLDDGLARGRAATP